MRLTANRLFRSKNYTMDKWLAPAEAVHLTAAAYKSCYLATTTKVRQSVDDLY